MQTGYATFRIELLQIRGGPYISLGRLLQDQLVQRQVGDRTAQPLVRERPASPILKGW